MCISLCMRCGDLIRSTLDCNLVIWRELSQVNRCMQEPLSTVVSVDKQNCICHLQPRNNRECWYPVLRLYVLAYIMLLCLGLITYLSLPTVSLTFLWDSSTLPYIDSTCYLISLFLSLHFLLWPYRTLFLTWLKIHCFYFSVDIRNSVLPSAEASIPMETEPAVAKNLMQGRLILEHKTCFC